MKEEKCFKTEHIHNKIILLTEKCEYPNTKILLYPNTNTTETINKLTKHLHREQIIIPPHTIPLLKIIHMINREKHYPLINPQTKQTRIILIQNFHRFKLFTLVATQEEIKNFIMKNTLARTEPNLTVTTNKNIILKPKTQQKLLLTLQALNKIINQK